MTTKRDMTTIRHTRHIEQVKRNIRRGYESIGRIHLGDSDGNIDYITKRIRMGQDELRRLGVEDVMAQESEPNQPDYKGAFELLCRYLQRKRMQELAADTNSSAERAWALETALAFADGICEAKGIDEPSDL